MIDDIIEIPSEAVKVGRVCYSEEGYHVTFRIGDHLYGCFVGQPSKQELGQLLKEHSVPMPEEYKMELELKSL